MAAMTRSFDWYPSSVRVGDASYEKARILVTAAGRAVVWTRLDGKLERVADAEVTGVKTDMTREKYNQGSTLSVTTSEGQEWTCVKGGGCGCNDALKTMRVRRLLA